MLCPSCFHDMRGTGKCLRCAEPRDGRLLPLRHPLKQGAYVVGEVLGKPGGFGVAYKALDVRQGAIVVIKECLLMASNQISRDAGDPRIQVNGDFEKEYRKWIRRFREEADRIARFESPYIVRVSAEFEENNTAYYVMPFVDGMDLFQLCKERERPLPETEIAAMTSMLLQALQEIHEAKVVHRDIKPSNILITRNRRKPVLIDFGAAFDFFDDELSRSRMATYTQAFAPPEQIRLMKNQGPWTDLYSLCATLHYCLLGKPPPPAIDREDSDTYEPIRTRLPSLDARLADLIDGGLALKPRARLQSADQALRILEGPRLVRDTDPDPTPPVLKEPPGSGPTGPSASPPRSARPWITWPALLPAAGVLGWGVTQSPDFPRYISGIAGSVVVANLAAWILWVVNRRVRAESDAAADPGNAGSPPTTSRGQPSTFPPQTTGDSKVATRVVGIEIRLLGEGATPIVRELRPGQKMIVGRARGCDVAIANELLSGRHVSIEVTREGRFRLQDLGSLNHTYVYERSSAGRNGAWSPIRAVTDAQGRFTLGPHEGGGILLEISQKEVEP